MADNTTLDRLTAVATALSAASAGHTARLPVNPVEAPFKTTAEGVVTTHKGAVVFTPPKFTLSQRLKKG